MELVRLGRKAQDDNSEDSDAEQLDKVWLIFSDNHIRFSNEFIGKIASQPKATIAKLTSTFQDYVKKCYDPAFLSYKNAKEIMKKKS